MNRVRSRRAGLVVGLVGAGLVLLTMSLTWGTARGASSSATVVLTGREAAPAAFALSLAALAGVGVLLLVGVAGRRVVGAVLVLLGCGVVMSGSAAALDLSSRALSRLSGTSLVGANQIPHVTTSPWWAWLAVAGGILVVVAGVLAVLGGPGWPDPSSRYGSAAGDRPADPWRALDEGVDPTLDA